MKTIAVLSGDKRQAYAYEYLKQHGYHCYLKNNMDFHDENYILCGTPFTKNQDYINCDFHSSFPVNTFLGLLKKQQTVFGGNIPKTVIDFGQSNGITFSDLMHDPNIAWKNATLTAEGLIAYMITKSDASLSNANILILGFGKCGMNIARLLHSFTGNITIYDHTPTNLSRAESFGYTGVSYEKLNCVLTTSDWIINTVPSKILTPKHYEQLNKNCNLVEIASAPYGFDPELSKKNNLSLDTCPGLPGKYSPKNAGELIAKSVISYIRKDRIDES